MRRTPEAGRIWTLLPGSSRGAAQLASLRCCATAGAVGCAGGEGGAAPLKAGFCVHAASRAPQQHAMRFESIIPPVYANV
jgi:hypothetical protein